MDSFQAKPYTKKGADQTQAGDPPDKIYRREENMPSKYLEPLLKQLALEYNCAPGDFLRPDNIVTRSCLRENRRHYSDEKPFFHMATLGQNAVITADRKLHPFLRIFAREKGRTLFEFPSLLPLERELSQYGYTLMSSFHMFLPKHDVRPESRYPVQWFYGEAIYPFYDKAGFENALNGKNCARPDRIAVCAMDGTAIMGMAGCSEDAPGWLQIGVDVMPAYRSRGVGTYLVALLKNEIIARGAIPFYGTSLSNYHSWNIAINSGFYPAWVEIGAKKKPLS